MKNNVIISGFNVHDNNRGTAALSYGSVSFLLSEGYIKPGQKLINFRFYKNIFKKVNRTDIKETISIGGLDWEHVIYNIPFYEKELFIKFDILLPFFKLYKLLRKVSLVAAINGGDGFSDIYGDNTFQTRLVESNIGFKYKIPHVVLPQTIGPFKSEDNLNVAIGILRNSTAVYVRDKQFVDILDKYNLKYEVRKDLSFYMEPEPWDISVPEGSIGINVSGLAYSNKFRDLSGQFDEYPDLIKALVEKFINTGHKVFLIPHSYNFTSPEINNDDIVACENVYKSLNDRTNVELIKGNFSSPQTKYLISKMKYFIGTRMHANFAAIYTHVPVFGLAYSYKFDGAFIENGIFNRTCMINNILKSDIDRIIEEVFQCYIDDTTNA